MKKVLIPERLNTKIDLLAREKFADKYELVNQRINIGYSFEGFDFICVLDKNYMPDFVKLALDNGLKVLDLSSEKKQKKVKNDYLACAGLKEIG